MTCCDIVCRRESGRAVVEGVPHEWHSPTGFEWGYGGSGPADLVLNILLAASGDRDFAAQHHQAFKWRFVADLPREGGIIRGSDAVEWIPPQTCGQFSKHLAFHSGSTAHYSWQS